MRYIPRCSCGKIIDAPSTSLLRMYDQDSLNMEYACPNCRRVYSIRISESKLEILNELEIGA